MTGGNMSGSGTSADPYIVMDATDLQAIGTGSYALSAYYKLGADIDLTEVTWTPICTTSATAFQGVLDGNGHTISNLVVDAGAVEYAHGFFGYISGTSSSHAMIKNLKMTGLSVSTQGLPTGVQFTTISGLATYVSGYFEMIGCDIQGNLNIVRTTAQTNGECIAGLIGSMQSTKVATISNCNINVNVKSTGSSLNYFYCGGITGRPPVSDSGHLGVICCVISGELSGSGSRGTYIGSIISTTNMDGAYLEVVGCVSMRNRPVFNGSSFYGQIHRYYVAGGSGTNADNRIGLGITSAQYNSQSWWQNTAGYDFANTWYWDSTDNLPKLQVFNPSTPSMKIRCKVGGAWKNITSVKTKVGGTWKNVVSAKTKSGGTWKRV